MIRPAGEDGELATAERFGPHPTWRATIRDGRGSQAAEVRFRGPRVELPHYRARGGVARGADLVGPTCGGRHVDRERLRVEREPVGPGAARRLMVDRL